MKKFKTILVMAMALSITFSTADYVGADTATDLESMTVYAVDSSGNQTEVSMDFDSTTYTYDLTVMSDTESIAIEATTSDSTSTWSIEKDGINTIMDYGTNLTVVQVQSSAGAVQEYTLNTTKLTAAEEATYEADSDDAEKSDSDVTVMVDDVEMKISTSFSKSDIPEGFKRGTAKYNGETYKCIKGEVKDLTAFYLYNDDTEGFYIYDSDNDTFYKMNNIQIKSRMYTIVETDEIDELLDNYDKDTVTVMDCEVQAWVLDEEEGMYLLYAMNWDGETNLYCYDDEEKCFQRYLTSSDATAQIEAANTAYENLQRKYNNLVDKYNLLLKILCGLAVVIIILIFVIINLAINKKEKRLKTGEDKKDKGKNKYGSGSVEKSAIAQDLKQPQSETASEDSINSNSQQVPVELSEDTEEDEQQARVATDDEVSEDVDDDFPTINAKSDVATIPKKLNRTYGDEPTFGTDEESDEGFYGGEIEEEDEVLIDLTDDEPEEAVQPKVEESKAEKVAQPKTEELKEITQEEIESNTESAQQEAEEDLKETLKSMLPDDDDDDDDDDNDDDFEFIDLN